MKKKLIAGGLILGSIASISTLSVAVLIDSDKNTTDDKIQNDALEKISAKTLYSLNGYDLFEKKEDLFAQFVNNTKITTKHYFGSLNNDYSYVNKELGIINISNFAETSSERKQAYIKMNYSDGDNVTHDISIAQQSYVKTTQREYMANDGSSFREYETAEEYNKQLVNHEDLALYKIKTPNGEVYINPLSLEDLAFFEKLAIQGLVAKETPFSLVHMFKSDLDNNYYASNEVLEKFFLLDKMSFFKYLGEKIKNEKSAELEKLYNNLYDKLTQFEIPIQFRSEQRKKSSKSITTRVKDSSSHQTIYESKKNEWMKTFASLDFMKNMGILSNANPDSAIPYRGKWYESRVVDHSTYFTGTYMKINTSSTNYVELDNHNTREGWRHYIYKWNFYPEFKLDDSSRIQKKDIDLYNNSVYAFLSGYIDIALDLLFNGDQNKIKKFENIKKAIINDWKTNIKKRMERAVAMAGTTWKYGDGNWDMLSYVVSAIVSPFLSLNSDINLVETFYTNIINQMKQEPWIITIAYNGVPIFKINETVSISQSNDSTSINNLLIKNIINSTSLKTVNISSYIHLSENGNQFYYNNDSLYKVVEEKFVIPENIKDYSHNLSTINDQKLVSNAGIYVALDLFNNQYIKPTISTPNPMEILTLHNSVENKYIMEPVYMGRIFSKKDISISSIFSKNDSILWTKMDWDLAVSNQAPKPITFDVLLGYNNEILGKIKIDDYGGNGNTGDDPNKYQKEYDAIVANISPSVSTECMYVLESNGSYKKISTKTNTFYYFTYQNEEFCFETLNQCIYYMYTKLFEPYIIREVIEYIE